jgi:hypothetical protein
MPPKCLIGPADHGCTGSNVPQATERSGSARPFLFCGVRPISALPRRFRWHDRRDLSHWGSEPLRFPEDYRMKRVRLSAFEWVLSGIAAVMLGSFLYIFLTSMHW